MAKGIAKVKIPKQQLRAIAKKLNTTQKAIQELADSTNESANAGLQYAKMKLALAVNDPDFTQKYGYSLVDEIAIEQKSIFNYTIYAPKSGDNDIKYNMYFAEYGAGLGASQAERSAKGVVELDYVPTRVIQDGEYQGYWFYNLLQPEPYVNKEGEVEMTTIGFTNTSGAVNFMWSARRLMGIMLQRQIQNCEKKIGAKFKVSTRNKRPTKE